MFFTGTGRVMTRKDDKSVILFLRRLINGHPTSIHTTAIK